MPPSYNFNLNAFIALWSITHDEIRFRIIRFLRGYVYLSILVLFKTTLKATLYFVYPETCFDAIQKYEGNGL